MHPAFSKPLSASTRLCAVFGHPVRHSGSPAMQNAAMAAMGLDWRYVAFDVPPDELAVALRGAMAMRFAGVNLTVPHKLLAVSMVDALDESASTWGAVNTVRFEGRNAEGEWTPLGRLAGGATEVRARGFNTDADAISRSLSEDLGLTIRGARILVLGAGGAGRTAALKLASDKAGELYLVNRTRAKAERVGAEIRSRFPDVKVQCGYPTEAVALVLNATSLGLKADDPLPLDTDAFPLSKAATVYDMIYSPVETPLLKRAASAGCRVANGVGMLIYQGARALELWTGQAAPVRVMRQALEDHLYGV